MDRFEKFAKALQALEKGDEAMITIGDKKFVIRLATNEQIIMHGMNVFGKVSV